MRRSAVTAGTCWLKCIRSVTTRRYGEIGKYRPSGFDMASPRAMNLNAIG